MNKFYITFTSCDKVRLDCEKIKNYLTANKLELASSPKNADYLFISTCGLTKTHEDLSINKILQFEKFNGKVIVCGCLPSMNLKRIRKIFNGKCITTKDIDKIDELFPDFKVKFNDISSVNKIFVETNRQKIKQKLQKLNLFYLLKFLNKCSPFDKINRKINMLLPFIIDFNNNFFALRISSGCLGNCTYCNIKKAIGKLRSKPTHLILEEVRRGLLDKQYILSIISSDTGSYGLDIGSNLPRLLNAILSEDKRIVIDFLPSLHPMWICHYKSELIRLVKTKRIRSFLTPFQSGSERILKLMNRYTDLNEFKSTLNEMKNIYPSLRLRTQVIVGFPTETEKDFQDTINFIKECNFDEVDVLPYHETAVTDSAKIKPKVSADVISNRLESIRLPNNVIVHICQP
ncbi:MAG: radical SAM protein [Nanoarchaeota archaeon]